MYNIGMITKKELNPDFENTTQNNQIHQLWLYNDDVNSFDDVIDSLIEVCKHDPLQAEQCAVITHTKGKCVVKKGEMKELEVMLVALFDRGLTVSIK